MDMMELLQEIEMSATRVAFLSTPSLFFSLKDTALKSNSVLFDVRSLRPPALSPFRLLIADARTRNSCSRLALRCAAISPNLSLSAVSRICKTRQSPLGMDCEGDSLVTRIPRR
jgi:hypothetical protein